MDETGQLSMNMETFPSVKHLCSSAGLTPTNNASAGKKKSVWIKVLKSMLSQATPCTTSNTVIRSENHSEIVIATFI